MKRSIVQKIVHLHFWLASTDPTLSSSYILYHYLCFIIAYFRSSFLAASIASTSSYGSSIVFLKLLKTYSLSFIL